MLHLLSAAFAASIIGFVSTKQSPPAAPVQAVRSHVLLFIGDSMMAGFHSVASVSPMPAADPDILVWYKWMDVTSGRGRYVCTPAVDPLWTPLPYQSNQDLMGPSPVWETCREYKQRAGVDRVYAVYLALPQTDTLDDWPNGSCHTWSASNALPVCLLSPSCTTDEGLLGFYRDYYLEPALQSLSGLQDEEVYVGGIVMSLGNNMANSTDANLIATFGDEAEALVEALRETILGYTITPSPPALCGVGVLNHLVHPDFEVCAGQSFPGRFLARDEQKLWGQRPDTAQVARATADMLFLYELGYMKLEDCVHPGEYGYLALGVQLGAALEALNSGVPLMQLP